MAADGCIFCAIVAGEIEAEIVFEGEHTLAFLDRRPLFPGHVLLVPREHHETIEDLPPELVDPFFADGRRLAVAVREGIGSQGTFMAINNFVSQSVPHLHLHVVPRNRKDGLRGFFWPRNPYDDPEHLAEVGARVREALDDPA